MSSTTEKVLAEGLQLPPEDRRRIAEELWNSLPEESRFEFDDEFWAEMERRDREMNEDPSMALTHEEVMASVEEAIRQVAAEKLLKSSKISERGASAP
jgi:putative addiction module component (TIGR02574 family)